MAIKHFLTVFEILALSLLSLFPVVAVPLFGILRLYHLRFSHTWFVIWLGFALPLVVTRLLIGDSSSAGFYTAQAGLGLLAAWLLFSTRQRLWWAFLLPLLVLNISGYAERWLTANAWRDFRSTPNHVRLVGVSTKGTVQRLESTATRRTALRLWKLPTTTQLLLGFEARLVAGRIGWDWQSKNDSALLEPLTENEKEFTRFKPSPEAPSITRQFDVQRSLTGRTFRVTLELRSLQDSTCGALVMLEAGGTARNRQELCLDKAWQIYSFTWTPLEASEHQLNVLLTGFKETIDIATLHLEEQHEALWVDQGLASPVGALLRVQELNLSYRFLPTSNWQRYEWLLEEESFAALDRLALELWLERGVVLEIRSLSLSSVGTSEQPVAMPSEPRQSFWFGHPNLAGHTIAFVGLSFISQVTSLPWALVGFALTASGIWLTGSRTAWFVSLFTSVCLLWLVCPAKQRRYLWLVMVVVAGLIAISFGSLGRLTDLDIEGTVSRLEVWRVAWQAFTDYWQQHGDATVSLEHAHNFWLSLASSYGVAGLASGLWLSAGLLYMAWRTPGWRATTIIVAVFVMNFFDTTLLHATLLLPVILVLNSLAQVSSEKSV
jgi:hypothetical protein